MNNITLTNVSKSYGGVAALRSLSLLIEEGEFMSLLGPSGCGKSTTLGLVAGFLEPDTGVVAFGGRPMNDTPPHKRNVGMVFQNYALFPHLTVFENVAFGLRIRKTPGTEVDRRVKRALDLVRLAGHEERFPRQLSGGQQQRVALARALVIDPAVLLLDEPLSNLDAKLRIEMREELVAIQRRVGITTIFVTHDQEEALSISDRVAVMNTGVLEQVGRPQEIYQQPASVFVARFVGQSNLFEGTLEAEEHDNAVFRTDQGARIRVSAAELGNSPSQVKAGARAGVLVRPEHLRVGGPVDEEANRLTATLRRLTYLGPTMLYQLEAQGVALTVMSLSSEADGSQPNPGEEVMVQWPIERTRLLRLER